jgi:hypothetical protein
MPRLVQNMIRAVPPYEKNGNGTPTTGKRPKTMAVLIIKDTKMIPVIPIANNVEKISLPCLAMARPM